MSTRRPCDDKLDIEAVKEVLPYGTVTVKSGWRADETSGMF